MRVGRDTARPAVDDADLLEQARRGDRAAFAELFDRYVDRIYTYCMVRLRNVHDAEDCTEQTFLNAFQSIGKHRGTSLGPWLYRIAHRTVLDRVRASDRQNAALTLIGAERAQDPEAALDRRIEEERLREAIRRLTPDQQNVIILRFVEGMTLSEAAAAVGKRVSAVEKLQSRGLAALARLLTAPD
jgi:RNA polymerase sigma-70 factor (ECF subfamily)